MQFDLLLIYYLFDYSEAALGGFFVERGDIVAGLLHHFHYAVEVYAVAAIGEGCVQIGVKSAGSGVGIALDTRYLHKAAHGVAGKAKVMLKAHFSRLFNLGRCPAKQL